ncbi:MAG: serpin family protein [bacterium]
MSRSLIYATLCALILCIGACSDSSDSGAGIPPGEEPYVPGVTQAELAAAESTLTDATLDFGLELFRHCVDNAEPTENVFISPLSVIYALILAGNGAAGDTKDAFQTTLGLIGHSDEAINLKISELTRILAAADPDVQFRAANSIWSRAGKALVPEYVELCRNYLEARVSEMDFHDPAVADTINNWVAKNTNDKIKEIVNAGELADMACLLLNAIYFKANWTYPFDTSLVRTAPFYLADGSVKDCELMARHIEEDEEFFEDFSERPIAYFANDVVKGVELPYGCEGFYLTVLMPSHSDDLHDLNEALTPENWGAWLTLGRGTWFYFAMPKFTFEFDIDLSDILRSMGLDIVFSPTRADFSGMFVDGVGWIDLVKHKTFVKVDEFGTEAAAVTSIAIFDAEPPSLIANRPFIVVIHEKSTGAILFIGRISDPVWEE